MRKNLLFFVMALLLPVLASAQSGNMAISKSHKGANYGYYSLHETHLEVPFAAIGEAQEPATAEGRNFSVGVWFKTTAIHTTDGPNNGNILRIGTKNHIVNNGMMSLTTSSTGALSLMFGTDNVGGQETVSCGTAAFNEWHHVMIVIDSANGKATVYLDGTKAGETSTVTKFGYKWDDGVMQLLSQSISGALDEVQCFNKALTAEEVAAAHVNARTVNGLTSLYTLDEVLSGTTGQFASVAGSVTGEIAHYYDGTYGDYWGDGLVNRSSVTETAPTLVEGREVAYDVNVTVMQGEGGTLTVTRADGTTQLEDDVETVIPAGETLTLVATPDAGYKLIGIYAVEEGETEGTLVTGNTYLTVSNVTLTARFSNTAYALTVENSQNVPYTLTLNGTEVTDLTSLMGDGAEYRLTLNVPEETRLNGVTLNGTAVEANADGSYSLFFDANSTLVIDAVAKAKYTVTINQPTGGTVSVAKADGTAVTSGTEVIEGTVLTLTATNNAGYTFVNYVVNGANTTSNTVTVNADVTISALFEAGIEHCTPTPVSGRTNGSKTTRTDRYVSSIDLTDETNSVTVQGGGSTSGRDVYTDRTSTVFETEAGKTVKFTVHGGGEWMNTYIYADFDANGLDADDIVYNNYNRKDNHWSPIGNDGYNGSTQESKYDIYDISFVVPANTPGGNYRVRYLLNWDEGQGPCEYGQSGDNGDAVIDFTIKVKSTELENPRTVTVVSENADMGTVAITSPATTETSLSTTQAIVSVTATPATGCGFINWTNAAGEVVSTDATYRYEGTSDVELTAHFGYIVTLTVGDNGSAAMTDATGVTVASGSVVAPGTELTVTATPTGEYILYAIKVNGESTKENPHTFTVNGATTVEVEFADALYALTISSTGHGTVEAWSACDGTTSEPQGTQYTNGSELRQNNNVVLYFIPDEGEELVSASIVNGANDPLTYPDGAHDTFYNSEDGMEYQPEGKGITWCTWEIAVGGNMEVSAVFSANVVGIDGIEADDNNAPVEYYNLQGVKVNAENLVPGIYIRRQGSKASKVFVK